jgi:Domain of unknown function (DUF4190)
LTDQPANRPESQLPDGSTPPGFEPRFAPPYGSEAPSQPQYGQSYGQGGYSQNPYEGQSQYGAYQQPGPYGQAASPYGQATSPYNQQSLYNQQGYYGMPAEPKTLSIASMVCGIASVIMGWILLPQIAAIVTGHLALKREPSGKGMSITGLVLGYLCLLGYGAFWLLAIIGLAIASSSTSSSYTF